MKHDVDELILDMLRVQPRSQAEITHASPYSEFGTIYRLMRLESRQEIVAERDARHHSTIYRIESANEKKKGSSLPKRLYVK
jgi:hypothetical protein